MASLVAKKKGHKLYYYLVESARVDGKPRIVHQTYLGTAEKVAALVRDRSAPLPLEASFRHAGLPGALWWAAKETGVFDLLLAHWPEPRSGPSTAHYLLLAALNRICEPGPKTDVAAWYAKTILPSLWQLPAERFTSQAFWDCFEKIQLGPLGSDTVDDRDDLDRAQIRLLGLWKDRQMVGQRVLSYDATNFYTFVASTNDKNTIAQRGHNKQGRDNLRQVGLSYALDGTHGLSVYHHVYHGNLTDTEEFSTSLPRLLRFLDENQIARESVTLVFDKGSAALANTIALEKTRVGWISALPWSQAPEGFRETHRDQLTALSSDHPGVRAAQARELVHGTVRSCVLKLSNSFLTEQIHSLSTTLTKAVQALRHLSLELAKPDCRLTEEQIRTKIDRRLKSAQFLDLLIRTTLTHADGRWRLQFDVDIAAFNQLMTRRLGRTVLMTNRMEWSAEEVVAAYEAQQNVEQVFRGLKDGDWLGWGPMYHWTDSKIRIHAFYCMVGLSLLNYVHSRARRVCPQITVEQLKKELSEIHDYVLLYPPQGEKGPPRMVTVRGKQTFTQLLLAQEFGLQTAGPARAAKTRVGKTQ